MCEKKYFNKKYKITSGKNITNMITGKYTEENSAIITDPNGSYTGIADPKYEQPIQDADDL